MNPSVMTNGSKRFRPGLVIALIGCVLLAIGMLAKQLRGGSSRLPEPPQFASPKEASSTLLNKVPETLRQVQGGHKRVESTAGGTAHAEPFDGAQGRLVEARGGVVQQPADGARLPGSPRMRNASPAR